MLVTQTLLTFILKSFKNKSQFFVNTDHAYALTLFDQWFGV